MEKETTLLPFQEKEFPELVTITQAAQIIGVQYRQLLDAVNGGVVPYYRLGKSRRLLRVTEVISIMKKQQGGNHD